MASPGKLARPNESVTFEEGGLATQGIGHRGPRDGLAVQSVVHLHVEVAVAPRDDLAGDVSANGAGW